jgi:hypothetical protein
MGLAVGPEFLFRRLSESLIDIRETVGDSIVRYDLASLSRQLDEELAVVSRMRVRRDALLTRLQDLRLRSLRHPTARRCESRRATALLLAGGRWDEKAHEPASDLRSQRYSEDERGAPWAEDALASIAPEIKRVDDQIATVERDLQGKERELFVLEATTEARRIRQELAASGEPLSWSARVGRLTEFLGPMSITPNSN